MKKFADGSTFYTKKELAELLNADRVNVGAYGVFVFGKKEGACPGDCNCRNHKEV